MIFRKPDAFIIKHIKLIHGIIFLSLAYLLLKISNISNLYTHLVSVKTIVGESNLENLFNVYMYLVLFISLILNVLIMILLIKKKKKCIFYIVSTIFFTITLIFCVMSYKNIEIMQKNNISAQDYLAYNDFSKIIFYSQSIFVFIYLFKATGFDFKTFTLGENVFGVDLTDADSEEIEFNLEIDGNELKTKKRRTIRELKYFYFENSFKINLVLFLCLVILAVIVNYKIDSKKEIYYSIGDELSSRGYNLKIDKIYLSNVDYGGNKIIKNGNDVFLIMMLKLKKIVEVEKTFDSSNVYILINGAKYYSSDKYLDNFSEFGVPYKEQKLTSEYNDYFLVFQIPYEFSTRELEVFTTSNFNYENNSYNYYKIKGTYNYIEKNITKEFQLNEIIDIDAYGIQSQIKINDVSFQEKYKLQNQEEINDKIYDVVEYIVPTATDDEDKAIMKIKYVETLNENNKVSFANILNKYSKIEYVKNGEKYQGKIYSYLSPSLSKEPNTYYIQVSKDILNGKNKKIVITIRNKIYKYNLEKGD